MQACRDVLSPQPLFVVITAYAIRASALSLCNSLQEIMSGTKGVTTCGELAIEENSAHRLNFYGNLRPLVSRKVILYR